jgi:hypothetical protein
MKIHQIMCWLLVAASLEALPGLARAQSLVGPEVSSGPVAVTIPAQPRLTYVRPTETTKLHNYFFDAFGPYPFAVSALESGIDQAMNTPPEWRQGAVGYSRRFASNFGIAAVGTTTRYALSEVFKEDALYYRCECTGLFPRLRHAVISTLTARRGEDGHRVFSVPALVAPYVGSLTAVYGWYPRRYGAQDAFRMGNYTLLQYVGANISLEFLDSGSHSLLKRLHLNNGHGAPNPDS